MIVIQRFLGVRNCHVLRLRGHVCRGCVCLNNKRCVHFSRPCVGTSKVSDDVYMEVVVGGEEPVSHERSYDGTALSKDFMPVAWAAAYGE